MDIVKIVGVGIIAVFLSMTVRAHKPELGVLTALSAATVILIMSFPYLKITVDSLKSLSEDAAIDDFYIRSVLKIIGIAYITQLSSELARDANESMLSQKLELAGKIGIAAMMTPIINTLLKAIIDALSVI